MDFGTMRNRIVDEMSRPDLETQTSEAILSAIAYFKNRPIASNQTSTSWTATVIGQRDYTLPADFISTLRLQVAANGITTDVGLRTYNEIKDLDQNPDDPQTGTPLLYAIFNDLFWIWPRSDSVSTLYQLDYVSSLEAPVDDEDDGFWMDEAERAVRCRAKGILWDDVIIVPDKADRQFAHADREWKEITKKLEMREFARGIRPYPRWGSR